MFWHFIKKYFEYLLYFVNLFHLSTCVLNGASYHVERVLSLSLVLDRLLTLCCVINSWRHSFPVYQLLYWEVLFNKEESIIIVVIFLTLYKKNFEYLLYVINLFHLSICVLNGASYQGRESIVIIFGAWQGAHTLLCN